MKLRLGMRAAIRVNRPDGYVLWWGTITEVAEEGELVKMKMDDEPSLRCNTCEELFFSTVNLAKVIGVLDDNCTPSVR